MDIIAMIRGMILELVPKICEAGLISGINTSRLSVGRPNDPSHGDIATNFAFVAARSDSIKPINVAEFLCKLLMEREEVFSAEVAGGGFVNCVLAGSVWDKVLRDIQEHSIHFGQSLIGVGKKVNVEFVSANPTGPLHIGHARNAVLGSVISNILEFMGYDVTREYYINDAGGQIDSLVRSLYFRYLECCGDSPDPGDLEYPGDYLVDAAKNLFTDKSYKLKLMDEVERKAFLRQYVIKKMMQLIKNSLEKLDVQHDNFFAESDLHKNGQIDEVIQFLKEKGLVYSGVIEEPPKGKQLDNWQPREQLLFKSSAYGDDNDRALNKADGAWTYFAADLAYHKSKVVRGFDSVIMILGVDHGGYVSRMKAMAEAIDSRVQLEIKLQNLVNLTRNGEPVKMSKRAGNFLTIDDLIDEVGKDVSKFCMLTKRNDLVIDFDFDLLKENSKDNPIFYIQYANARICSVQRKSFTMEGISLKDVDLSLLAHPLEREIVKHMATLPSVLLAATEKFEPHILTAFLIELASLFHSLWNKGTEDSELLFIKEDNIALTNARLYLLDCIKIVIAIGLSLFNIEPVKSM